MPSSLLEKIERIDLDWFEPGDCIEDFGVYARWASSTGFRSVIGTDDCMADARALFERAKESPYLVGRADCDMWKELSTNWKNPSCVQIRLPDWHDGSVANALADIAGLTVDDEINNYWIFPREVPTDVIRRLLAPVLRKGTRLQDQMSLAEEIRRTEAAQQLRFMFAQTSLF